MNLQNFEIEKIDVFSIGYSKKSFRYKKYEYFRIEKTNKKCSKFKKKLLLFIKLHYFVIKQKLTGGAVHHFEKLGEIGTFSVWQQFYISKTFFTVSYLKKHQFFRFQNF